MAIEQASMNFNTILDQQKRWRSSEAEKPLIIELMRRGLVTLSQSAEAKGDSEAILNFETEEGKNLVKSLLTIGGYKYEEENNMLTIRRN